MVSNDNAVITVHYLSPRVLTRTRMTPDRIKSKQFTVTIENSLAKRIINVFNIIISKNINNTDNNTTKYDYRLCITINDDDMLIDSNCDIVKNGDRLLSISPEDKASIQSIFSELDSISIKNN